MGRKGGTLEHVSEVWRFREFLTSLIVRNLKVKYQRSVLGFIWTLLNPLLTVAVIATIFSYVVRIAMPQYWAFLLSGYFVWNYVMQTLSSGTYVLGEHAQLSRSVAFPKEIPVLAAAISRLFEFALELTLVLVALVIFRHGGVPTAFLLLPWLIAVQLLLSIGLVLPIATLSVFYRDVQHGLPILLTSLFYISPVFYPASFVPDAVRPLYMLNPIAGLLTLYQTVVYDGRLPSAGFVLIMTGAAVLLAWTGYGIFNRYQSIIPEVV